MQNDVLHFSTLMPPLSPNEYEVKIYKQFTKPYKNILLLGYTKELLPFCTQAIDINPPLYDHIIRSLYQEKISKGDWFHITGKYDCIIADGVLNLVGGSLMDHLKTLSDNIMIRFFTKKLPHMKYATIFADTLNVLIPNEIIYTQEGCVMLMWKK